MGYKLKILIKGNWSISKGNDSCIDIFAFLLMGWGVVGGGGGGGWGGGGG